MKKIGVMALQGAFAEHIHILNKLRVGGIEVRTPADFYELDGLIIPGGESTTISKLLEWYNLTPLVKRMAQEGKPILGTCAGMIVLAKNSGDARINSLSLMDISVKRNAFGRQVDSFEIDLKIPVLGEKEFRSIFIRAPVIEKVSDNVEILATLKNGSTIVAARQGNIIACAFHPELTDDTRFHEYFLGAIDRKNIKQSCNY